MRIETIPIPITGFSLLLSDSEPPPPFLTLEAKLEGGGRLHLQVTRAAIRALVKIAQTNAQHWALN